MVAKVETSHSSKVAFFLPTIGNRAYTPGFYNHWEKHGQGREPFKYRGLVPPAYRNHSGGGLRAIVFLSVHDPAVGGAGRQPGGACGQEQSRLSDGVVDYVPARGVGFVLQNNAPEKRWGLLAVLFPGFVRGLHPYPFCPAGEWVCHLIRNTHI